MQMNGATLLAYVIAVLTIIGGGLMSKFLSPEAGTALTALGGMLAGKVMQQPSFAQPKPPRMFPTASSEEPTDPDAKKVG